MNTIYKVGDTVRCAKGHPTDGLKRKPLDGNFPDDDTDWIVGDSFEIKDIRRYPYGTFLYNSQGHNLNARNAHIIGPKTIRTLGLYQPFAGLIAHGVKTIETRWVKQGKKPSFPLGQYLIYSTKKFYTPTETSVIAGNQYDRIIDFKNEANALHQYHFALRGSALCIADLTKVIYMIPNDREMERESFVRYTGPVDRVVVDKETKLKRYYKCVLIGLVFENIRRIQPFTIKGKQGIGFLSETDQNQIRFL